MKTKLILTATVIGSVFVLTQAQTPAASKSSTTIVIPSERLTTLQQTLNDQTDHGLRLASIAYHSSIKNLHSKGHLELAFVISDGRKYLYRVLTTEMEGPVLEKALNEGGAKGFRLLKQTPIPVELGFLRTRDLFVAVLENTPDSPTHYAYRVVAYRHRSYVQLDINRILADGFSQACSHQLGPVIYLVMEKVITDSRRASHSANSSVTIVRPRRDRAEVALRLRGLLSAGAAGTAEALELTPF